MLPPQLIFSFFIVQSEHFHSLSKEPVIASVSGFEGLDSQGKRSVEVELYCTVCGVDKVHNQIHAGYPFIQL